MLTSWSEQSTPAELSMASVLINPPPRAYSIRARWVKPEVATLADHPATEGRRRRPWCASLVRSLASAWVSAVALT